MTKPPHDNLIIWICMSCKKQITQVRFSDGLVPLCQKCAARANGRFFMRKVAPK